MISEWWSIGLTLGDITGHWWTGSRHRWAWIWNIGVELGWIAYAHFSGQAGFYLMSILHMIVFVRNWIKWGTNHGHAHEHPHMKHEQKGTVKSLVSETIVCRG